MYSGTRERQMISVCLSVVYSVVYLPWYILGGISREMPATRAVMGGRLSAMRRDGRFGCRTMDEHCWQRVAAAEG